METLKKRKPLPKHWYKQYIAECPVCGKDHSSRERVYGEKPKNPKEIYRYGVAYDWCDIDCRDF